jgi:hypothetical protein
MSGALRDRDLLQILGDRGAAWEYHERRGDRRDKTFYYS